MSNSKTIVYKNIENLVSLGSHTEVTPFKWLSNTSVRPGFPNTGASYHRNQS